jgi:hypothetical protein
MDAVISGRLLVRHDLLLTSEGESVSTDNPGCLEEHGRGSVKFHGVNIQGVNLVASPDSACSCQNNCNYDVVREIDSNPCFHLTGPEANSYRFIGSQVC